MRAFLLRRLALAVPTLLGVSFLVFALAHVGGDPARAIAGEKASAAEVESVRREYGLDRPLVVQYFAYLGGLARGDFGRSARSQKPVAAELREHFPATVELATAALLLAALFGIGAGIIAALRPGSLADLAVMSGSLIGVSVPVFFLGMLALFAFQGRLPGGNRLEFATVFTASRTGFLVIDALLAGRADVAREALLHLLLPACALATIPLSVIARLTRASMLETLSSDYVRTARAKGLSTSVVALRHALRNALVPIVTAVGLQYGTLLSGAVLTETVFSWPGIGSYVVDTIRGKDFIAMQGAILVIAACFVFANVAVDAAYGWLDPRISRG
ncbi:MAG: peptide/nickel transport system permease [Planctomycetota bacterium]|nr:MAG: peptide/nickel transport system permease [Planctomycetota bacterium]